MARGRRTAAACGALALLAVLGVLWASRGWLHETWLIWKLDRLEGDELIAASRELGARRCTRAVPATLRAWSRCARRMNALDVSGLNRSTIGRFEYLLEAVGGIGAPAVPSLTEALADPDPLVRLAALLTLEWEVPPGSEAIPSLEKLLRDPSSSIRGIAAAVLLKLGPQGRALAGEAIGKDSDIRAFALRMAGGAPFGAGSLEAEAAAVGDLLGIGEPEIRERALKHLLRSVRVPRLRPRSAGKTREERQNERARKAAGKALAAGMEGWTPEECAAVAEEISRLGSLAADLVPRLAECVAELERPEEVIDALGKIGARPEIAVPALAARLDDPSADIRYSALIAIATFGKAAAPAAPRLIPLLTDRLSSMRLVAVRCLSAIGPEAAAALPALQAAASDDWDSSVRRAAAEAIEAIRAARAAGPSGL